MSAFFGNMLISLKTGISATTLSAVANATTSSLTASVSGGRGTYTYSWVSSGIGCTITSPTAATTTFTGSSVTGNTSVYCAITDTITGNTLITPTCTITWTAIPVPVTQNVVIGGGPVTFNGAARAYTLTGTPDSPAPSGTPSSFVNAGTYVYPTNISITPGSGYTLGSVTGSFTISRLSISSMSFTLNGASFTGAQSRTAGTSYTIAVLSSSVNPSLATYSPASLTASTAGSYSLTSSGTGNYQGSFTSPVLTLTAPVVVSGSINETNRINYYTAQLTATLTGATATGYSWSRVSGLSITISPSSASNPVTVQAPSFQANPGTSTVVRCIISYSGGSVTASRTVQWGFE
jgi:hypothetical protein